MFFADELHQFKTAFPICAIDFQSAVINCLLLAYRGITIVFYKCIPSLKDQTNSKYINMSILYLPYRASK